MYSHDRRPRLIFKNYGFLITSGSCENIRTLSWQKWKIICTEAVRFPAYNFDQVLINRHQSSHVLSWCKAQHSYYIPLFAACFSRYINAHLPVLRLSSYHIEAGTKWRRFHRRHFQTNEIAKISIEISLKFVPSGPIDNISALVHIMAWRRTGDKPLFQPMMPYVADAYMRHSASVR